MKSNYQTFKFYSLYFLVIILIILLIKILSIYIRVYNSGTQLKSHFQNMENWKVCRGCRDGVSGCRDCCQNIFKNQILYQKCVDDCMKY